MPLLRGKLTQEENTMTAKAKREQYTLEFKLEAARLLVKAGQSMATVAATLVWLKRR
jgi:transposase-like protein